MVTALNYTQHGAQLFERAARDALRDLLTALAHLPPDKAGIRLQGVEELRPFLDVNGAIGSVAARILGDGCRAVRAILFDKTAETNWSLAWHQDRTICVKQRVDVAGFGPWTVKDGLQHVAPPVELLSCMVTLRVHFDDVAADNAPLLIAPGSHLLGRVPESSINKVVADCGVQACLAQAGDIWLYSTPILHASEAAAHPAHRRVLQVDFSAEELPGGLEWLGV